MPQGNVPSRDLALDYIPNKDGQWGAFGPMMLERTRIGLDNLLYLNGGSRGDRVTIIGWHYFNNQADADLHIEQTEAIGGNEVELKSLLDSYTRMVFIHRINGARRQIGSSNVVIDGVTKTISWRVLYNIDMQRTF